MISISRDDGLVTLGARDRGRPLISAPFFLEFVGRGKAANSPLDQNRSARIWRDRIGLRSIQRVARGALRLWTQPHRNHGAEA